MNSQMKLELVVSFWVGVYFSVYSLWGERLGGGLVRHQERQAWGGVSGSLSGDDEMTGGGSVLKVESGHSVNNAQEDVIPSCPTVCYSVPDYLWIKRGNNWKSSHRFFVFFWIYIQFSLLPFHFYFQSEIRAKSCNINKQQFLPYLLGPLSHSRNVFALDWEVFPPLW